MSVCFLGTCRPWQQHWGVTSHAPLPFSPTWNPGPCAFWARTSHHWAVCLVRLVSFGLLTLYFPLLHGVFVCIWDQGWPRTWSSPPASVSLVLGLEMWASALSSYYVVIFGVLERCDLAPSFSCSFSWSYCSHWEFSILSSLTDKLLSGGRSVFCFHQNDFVCVCCVWDWFSWSPDWPSNL